MLALFTSVMRGEVMDNTVRKGSSGGQLLAKNWHPEMRNVFLCHLSHENNDPNVALNTIKDILLDEGIMPGEDVFVTPLDRLKASPAYVLNNQVIK